MNEVVPARVGLILEDTVKMGSCAYRLCDINPFPEIVCNSYDAKAKSQYSYHADANLFRKYDGTVYTYYINGADGKTEAITYSNLPTTTYNLWGLDNVGKVVRNGTSLTRYYYLKDHLGSVRMTVDASGVRQSWNDYYPYGLLMDGRNGVIGDTDARYKFTSKERDVETSYDYFGARYYDSRIGRWMSVDPEVAWRIPSRLVDSGLLGLSPYQYVRDDPMNRIDFDGFTDWKVIRKGAGQLGIGLAGTAGAIATIARSRGMLLPVLAATAIPVSLAGASLGIVNIVAGFRDQPEQLPEGFVASIAPKLGISKEDASAISLALDTYNQLVKSTTFNAKDILDWINTIESSKNLSNDMKKRLQTLKQQIEQREKEQQDKKRQEEEKKRQEEENRKKGAERSKN